MSSEENRQAVKAFFEQVWNQGNVGEAQAFLSPDFVSHNGFGVQIRGPEQYAESAAAYRAAFAEFSTTIEDVVVEGDRVAVRGTDRGTHSAELFGYPATGQLVVLTWIEIFRLENGKAVEGWVEADMKRFYDQLSGAEHGLTSGPSNAEPLAGAG